MLTPKSVLSSGGIYLIAVVKFIAMDMKQKKYISSISQENTRKFVFTELLSVSSSNGRQEYGVQRITTEPQTAVYHRFWPVGLMRDTRHTQYLNTCTIY